MDEWLEVDANLRTWTSNKVSPSDRRVLLASSMAPACEEVCELVDIEALFHKVGACLTVDGSNDHVLRIEVVEDYTFAAAKVRNWFQKKIQFFWMVFQKRTDCSDYCPFK